MAKLIRIAADLATAKHLPSYCAEDHKHRIPKWVLLDLERVHEYACRIANDIKNSVDALRPSLSTPEAVESLDFDTWLKTVCFQKPTPEAYDLAKCAWEYAQGRTQAVPNLCHGVDFGTYKNTVSIMAPWGKMVTVDICMIPEIKWLWDRGIETIECCCGHGKKTGYVAVRDNYRKEMQSLGYIPDPKASHCYLSKSYTKPQAQPAILDGIDNAVVEAALKKLVNGDMLESDQRSFVSRILRQYLSAPPTPPVTGSAKDDGEWFFRWIARGKAKHAGMTMDQCADMIWHHPSNQYRENNPWEEPAKPESGE